MRTSRDFDPQDPNELESFGCDFVNDLAAGDSIVVSPAPVVTIGVIIILPNGQSSVWTSQSGVVCPDPLFATRLQGSPSFSGTLVSVMVGGCQPGVTYKLTFAVTTAAGNTKSLYAYIPPETSP